MKMKNILLTSLLFSLSAAFCSETVLFLEDFESRNTPPGSSAALTAGSFELVSPGRDSKKSLRAVKPDECGFFSCGFNVKIPETSRGRFLKITADLRTEALGIGSEYFLMVGQSAGGKSNGPNLFFAYDDGLVRQSAFGGQYKTPQTSGVWKQTVHQFQLRPDTDQLKVSLVMRGGEQIVYFDNLRISDVGTSALPASMPVIYAGKLDWPYGMIDLDDVIPGAVYTVDVQVSRPEPQAAVDNLTPGAQASPLSPPAGLQGMGIAMRPYGLDGRPMATLQLTPLSICGNRGTYRFVVPDMAVRVELDLHNDDLIRFNHNQLAAQARRYQQVTVKLDNYGEITADNAFYQYVYRGRPDKLKIRQFLELDPFSLAAIKHQLSLRPEARLELVNSRGGMCFRLNGTLIPPMAVSYNLDQDQYRWCDQLAESGINVVFARLPYGGVALGNTWKADGTFDFSGIDRNIYNILAQNPQAVIILSIDSIYPPNWWAEKNQSELMRDQDGNFVWSYGGFMYQCFYGSFADLKKKADALAGNPKEMHIARGGKESGFFLPSLSSVKYRQAVHHYLKALREHVDRQPYGKVVAGYRFLSGYDGQWGLPYEQLGYDRNGVHVFDFSAPSLKKFREFLKKRYGSDEGLRTAWKNTSVTLDTVSIPPKEIRDFDQMKEGSSFLLDPGKYRQLIDYRIFQAESLAALLNSYGKTIKEAGARPVLTFAYYPDIVETATGGGSSGRAHEIIYRSPWIDGVGGPSYDAREIGQPGRCNVLLHSTVANGKIHLNEMDHRLYTVTKRNYSGNMVFDSPRKTISVLQREYMRQMCSGNGSWLFDMGFGWYNEPLIAAILKNCYDVFNRTLNVDRSSNARMAVFLGNYGKQVQADARRGSIPKQQTAGVILKIAQAGFPVDQYQIADLERVAGRYKVFYFPFSYAMTPAERAAVNQLKKNGNILVFGFAAGYVSDDMSLKNVEDLTSFKLAMRDNLELTIRFSGKHPLAKGLDGFYFGGGGDVYSSKGLPGIYVDDPDSVSLGVFSGTGLTGAAVKRHHDWTAVYIGVPHGISPQFLRNIADFAGIHVYSRKNDVMYFNKSLIAVHASGDGLKTIRLPEEAEVISLWDNRSIGRVRTIERQMKLGENALYLLKK